MKIMLISDIHGNYQALKSLENYIDSVDMVFCLGDIVGYYCEINEVIDFLRRKKVICIAGNHDRYVIAKEEIGNKEINASVKFGIDYAIKILNIENRKWLEGLPTSISYTIEGISIFICHGSPWNVTNEYLYENLNEKLDKLRDFNFNIIAFGHTHRKLYKKLDDRKIILNPGSVGQARDLEKKVCATIIDLDKFEIKNLELEYNYIKVIELARRNGAGDFIYKHLGGDR